MCVFKFSEINSMRHSEIPQNHFVEFILWNFNEKFCRIFGEVPQRNSTKFLPSEIRQNHFVEM